MAKILICFPKKTDNDFDSQIQHDELLICYFEKIQTGNIMEWKKGTIEVIRFLNPCKKDLQVPEIMSKREFPFCHFIYKSENSSSDDFGTF